MRFSWSTEGEYTSLDPSAAHRVSGTKSLQENAAADPTDVAHVTFEIVDSAGTVVPTADNLVTFTVTGGSIMALDNADLRDHDPYHSDRRHAFNGSGLAILSAAQPGLLRLTASADGLRPATVSVQVVRGDAPQAVPAAR